MIDGRKRTAAALFSLCVAVGGGALVAQPSAAEPSIGEARERAETLYRQAEEASERYNDARLQLRKARTTLKALHSDLEVREQRVAEVRDQVAATVVASYQSHPLTTASGLVVADDPDAFLGQLATVSEYTSQQAYAVDELADELEHLQVREDEVTQKAGEIARTKRTLAEEKAVVDDKAADAERLLERLESQREERLSRSGGRTPVLSDVPASGRAGAAVQYALAQVGDSYVYGAAGPSAFDCSGLTMMAWAAAGVSLPHSSSAQMGSGTPVSSSALRAGDLVFYYSPVSHVGIYLGNGMVVHAANPSTGVRVDPVFSMPFSGAVRPG